MNGQSIDPSGDGLIKALQFIGGHDAAANGLSGFAFELVELLTGTAREALSRHKAPQTGKELLASDPDLAMRVEYERQILAAQCDAQRRVNSVLDWLRTCIRHARYTPDVIDHKAADTMENIAKRLEAEFANYGDDKAPLSVAGDDVEQVIEILWSMADTDGSPGDMRRCAERIVAALLVSNRSGVENEADDILRRIVGNMNEAMPLGPFDCIDNCGDAYQSQSLADALKAGRDYLARTALDTPTSDKGEG